MQTTKRPSLTIDKTHYRLIARNAKGEILAERSTNCNPAALAQIICDAETIGKIDWKNSMVTKPSRR